MSDSRALLKVVQDLTAIATRVGALESQNGDLTGIVNGLSARVSELPTAVDLAAALAGISQQIRDLSARLDAMEASGASEQATEPEAAGLVLWDWSRIRHDPATMDAALRTLRDWVHHVLHGVYGIVGTTTSTRKQGDLPRIPPCWDQHLDVVAELTWLYQEWTKIYGDREYGTPAKVGDWHDRWLPGVRRRLKTASVNPCLERGHQDPNAAHTANGAPPSRAYR